MSGMSLGLILFGNQNPKRGKENGKDPSMASNEDSMDSVAMDSSAHGLCTREEIYDSKFLDIIARLYGMHMGCENMGPMAILVGEFSQAMTGA